MKQVTCRYCRKNFEARSAVAVFCPPTDEDKAAGRRRSRCAERWNTADYLRRKGSSFKRTQYSRVCVVCGCDFESGKPDAKYCSTEADSCLALDRALSSKSKAEREADRERAAIRARFVRRMVKAAKVQRGLMWIQGECAASDCEISFTALRTQSWISHYCSKKCAKRTVRRRHRAKYGRLDQARKRARHHGVAYEPIARVAVFERDEYRCGICLSYTDPTEHVPHPRAPTLDHIIPMSKDGPHLYSNVQCACFECNWKKRDTLVAAAA